MITHHTEPDGTLVIRVSANERQDRMRQAAAIADKAAAHFDMALVDLLGTCRVFPLVDCRQMTMQMMREMGVSSLAIASVFCRDISSVGYGRRCCSAKLSTEPSFARRYEALRAAVLADRGEAA